MTAANDSAPSVGSLEHNTTPRDLTLVKGAVEERPSGHANPSFVSQASTLSPLHMSVKGVDRGGRNDFVVAIAGVARHTEACPA